MHRPILALKCRKSLIALNVMHHLLCVYFRLRIVQYLSNEIRVRVRLDVAAAYRSIVLRGTYHIISYQGFLVRPLLREPRPQVHYKSQPDAKAQRETQKSTIVKSLTKIE